MYNTWWSNISSIRYTKAQGGNGTEQLLIVGDGTNSAIWLWDDLSEGYGVSTDELTFVAELENFNNDTLTGSEIVFSSLWIHGKESFIIKKMYKSNLKWITGFKY